MRRQIFFAVFACLIWLSQSAFMFRVVQSGSAVASQAFVSIDIDNHSFVPNGATPVAVGNIVAVMAPTAPPAATSALALTGTNASSFQLTSATTLPSIVQAKTATCASPPQSFVIQIVGAESSASNSPFTSPPILITCSAPPACGAIITPLSGCTLVASSGTVSFANTQGPYGYDVLLNGVTNGIQATKLTLSGGLLVAKYDTAMPAAGVQTACLQETSEINNISAPMAFFLPTSCPPGM